MIWELEMENIAGIRSGSAGIDDGINVIQASNFRGKSSFLSALMGVIGTDAWEELDHLITEGMDKGSIVLDTGEEEFQVELTRHGDTVSLTGNTVLSDPEDIACARLFAFLDERNPVRRAVRTQDTAALADALQKPLEIESIDQRIATLQAERERVDREIDTAQQAMDDIANIEGQLKTERAELERLHERRDELENDVVEEDEATEELDERLRAKQTELGTINREIDRLENAQQRLDTQLEKKDAELSELDELDKPDHDADIEEKRSTLTELELQIDLVRDLHRSNRQLLEEDTELAFLTDVSHGITDDEVACWVCGEQTTEEHVEERLADLYQTLQRLEGEAEELSSTIEELERTEREFRRAERERERLKAEVDDLRQSLQEAEADLSAASDRKGDIETDIEALEAQLEEVDDEGSQALTEVNLEITRAEQRIEHLEEDLANVRDDAGDQESLREQRENLTTEIDTLRGRREQKQQELKERFDTAINDVIDRFAPGFESAYVTLKHDQGGKLDEVEINLSREIDGVGHAITIDQLSEGERELVGVITALAGYQTFNVRERVPVMLLDSISELAAQNLRGLLSYLEDHTDRLVTTAYPEAGEFEGYTIERDDWELVSTLGPSLETV